MSSPRAIGKAIFVQRLERPLVTKAGIYIPDQAAEKPQLGRVTSIGPEAEVILGISVGNIVMFSRFHDVSITLGEDDREYIILRPDEVMLVITDEG